MGARGPLLLLLLGFSLLIAGVSGLLHDHDWHHLLQSAVPSIAGVASLLTALYWQRSIQAAIAQTTAAAERELELRQIAHQRLIEREQWSRSFFENNPLVMLLVHPDTGRIVDANPAACTFYGHPRAALIKKGMSDLHTLSAAAVQESLQEALRGTSGQQIVPHRLADGTTRMVSVTNGPLWIGGRTMVFSIVHDVTAQIEAQRSIDRIINASPMGFHLYQVGPDGRLLFTHSNPAADRIFGISDRSLIGKPIEEVFPGERMQQALQRYAEIAREGGHWQFSDFAYSVRQTHGVFDVTAFQVTPGTLAIMFQDVTGRYFQQEQLRQAKQEAEKASAAKDRFLASLSHELRTPLTPVILSIKTLLANAMLDQSVRDDLVEVQHQVQLEACLISDLLDVTSIIRGRFRIHTSQCDLHQILRRAVNLCRSEALARSQRVELRLQAKSHIVQGDPARLQQVFWNILRNATKFTPENGTITIITRDGYPMGEGDGDGAEIVCEIVDTGIGMDAQTMSHIFEAFEKGSPTANRRYGGLGVGLAIARAIVEKHGGRISATSPGLDAGSRFTVCLKASEVSPLSALPVRVEQADPRALSVLLIEDDPGTLRSLARLLRLWRYEVTTANCAAAALAASASGRFDLIISDVGLPDGTGPGILPRLRDHNDVPAIAISGFGMEQDIRTSLSAGFSDHLIKPINPDTLQQVIRRLLCPVTS